MSSGAENTGRAPATLTHARRRLTASSARAAAPHTGYGRVRAGYGTAGGGDIHLLDYVRILSQATLDRDHRFLLVFGSVTVYTFTATPIYSARVQILIENENPNVVKFEEVYDQNKATQRLLPDAVPHSAEPPARAHERSRRKSSGNIPLLTGSASDRASLSIRYRGWTRAFVRRAFLSQPRRCRRAGCRGSKRAAQSRVIDSIPGRTHGHARSQQPAGRRELPLATIRSFAAALANALAKQYIEQNLEFKFLATKEATEFLNERGRGTAQGARTRASRRCSKYREKTGAMALEDRQNIVVQRLADLNAAVTRARTDRIEKESVYNQIRAIQNDRDGHRHVPGHSQQRVHSAAQGAAERSAASAGAAGREAWGRHPDMVKVAVGDRDHRNAHQRRSAEGGAGPAQRLPGGADQRAVAAGLARSAAGGSAGAQSRLASSTASLQRDATSNQTMFTGLLERSRETGISGELKTSNIRIVDPAERPGRPSSPNKVTNLSLAALWRGVSGRRRWRSSSSISTTASSSRKRSRHNWACRFSA